MIRDALAPSVTGRREPRRATSSIYLASPRERTGWRPILAATALISSTVYALRVPEIDIPAASAIVFSGYGCGEMNSRPWAISMRMRSSASRISARAIPIPS